MSFFHITNQVLRLEYKVAKDKYINSNSETVKSFDQCVLRVYNLNQYARTRGY